MSVSFAVVFEAEVPPHGWSRAIDCNRFYRSDRCEPDFG
jgi:hypothetical protein